MIEIVKCQAGVNGVLAEKNESMAALMMPGFKNNSKKANIGD
jgi:hypothetical protein